MGRATLVLAAGHGGDDTGNTAAGIVERDALLAITAGMRHWYACMGMPVGLGGVVWLGDELDLAGELAAIKPWRLRASDGDLAVDLHLDYRRNSPNGGALVLYDEVAYSRGIAEAFLSRWCASTGIKNNGCHRSTVAAQKWRGWPDYGFTAAAWPGMIIELGSLQSSADMSIVTAPFYQAFAAQLLYEVWNAWNGVE